MAHCGLERRSDLCSFADAEFVRLLLCEGDGVTLRGALSRALQLTGAPTKKQADAAVMKVYQRHLRFVSSRSLSPSVAVKVLQLLHAVTRQITADMPYDEAYDAAVGLLRRGLCAVTHRACTLTLCDNDAKALVDHCKTEVFSPARLLRFCWLRDAAVCMQEILIVLPQPPEPPPLEDAESQDALEQRSTQSILDAEAANRCVTEGESSLALEHMAATLEVQRSAQEDAAQLYETFCDARKLLKESEYMAVVKSLSYTIKKELAPGDEVLSRLHKLEDTLNTALASTAKK